MTINKTIPQYLQEILDEIQTMKKDIESIKYANNKQTTTKAKTAKKTDQ